MTELLDEIVDCDVGKLQDILNEHAEDIDEDMLGDALARICQSGNPEKAQILIHAGADVNYSDSSDYQSPLEEVICSQPDKGCFETVKLLIDNGAYLDESTNEDTWDTPLHLAATFELPDIMMLLIKSGAQLNVLNREGYTPLGSAICGNHNESAKILLENGADVNVPDSENLLYNAIIHNTEMVPILLKAGANVDEAIECATRRFRPEIAQMICKYTT